MYYLFIITIKYMIVAHKQWFYLLWVGIMGYCSKHPHLPPPRSRKLEDKWIPSFKHSKIAYHPPPPPPPHMYIMYIISTIFKKPSTRINYTCLYNYVCSVINYSVQFIQGKQRQTFVNFLLNFHPNSTKIWSTCLWSMASNSTIFRI